MIEGEAPVPPAARVVFLPTPGAGHLASTVEMAKCLASRFSVTVLTMRSPFLGTAAPGASPNVGSRTSSGLDVRITELPVPPAEYFFDPSNHPDGFAAMCDFIQAHHPHVRDTIASLLSPPSAPRIAAIFVDMFCTPMIDVGDELGIPTYVYFTSGAAMLGLVLYLPTLDVEVPSEMADVEGGYLRVPGFGVPVPPLALMSPLLDKKLEGYAWFVRHARRFREAKGIVVNTFAALEMTAAKALEEGRCLPDHLTPPVYFVGPLLGPGSAPAGHECLRWLDGRPRASVVFLCFGSMGSFAKEQVKEIALGLERSGHRFLWSLRTQSSGNADLGETLPEGFLERTAERGLVWTSWAPQREVLAHPAVGGFVTHCGWNSTLESVWNGVPMLAWPLYAEQKLNALQMARKTGLAVDVVGMGRRGEQEGVVGAAEVARGVRLLMGEGEEGRRARERAAEMKRRSREAMAEGGSSSLALARLVESLGEGVGRVLQ